MILFNLQLKLIDPIINPPESAPQARQDLLVCDHGGRGMQSSQIFQTIFNLILGSHMQEAEEERALESGERQEEVPNRVLGGCRSGITGQANRHLAFEKNYPKNIFIPLIEHLSEVGLRKEYEACVGTRESFEGKNVVSLAEIYRVMSQPWFAGTINLPALISNMSNKILMNSKIKKKLFHLLLVRDLFAIPLDDPREFKKLVSRRANEVALSSLPSDPLFDYPSALIYLLSLFADGLAESPPTHPIPHPSPLASDEESKNADHPKQREVSSKEEYKHYIARIVAFLNAFHGDASELLDLIEAVKQSILAREAEVRMKYGLAEQVPEWGYFCSIVVNGCYLHKRSKGKLTFSMLNQWIQKFKDKATSLAGFLSLKAEQEEDRLYRFQPIVLISPPQ